MFKLNPRTLLPVWTRNKCETKKIKQISFLQASKCNECSCHLFTFNVCNEFHFFISKPICILACEIAAQQKNIPQINLELTVWYNAKKKIHSKLGWYFAYIVVYVLSMGINYDVLIKNQTPKQCCKLQSQRLFQLWCVLCWRCLYLLYLHQAPTVFNTYQAFK